MDYSPFDYPPFAVAADAVILTVIDGELAVALVERSEEPWEGGLALPGGFIAADEDADAAVARVISEEIHLESAHLEQLKTYSGVDRDPRMRVISVAFVALLPTPEVSAGNRVSSVSFVPVSTVSDLDLAFDHNVIVADAVERVRSKFEYSTLATTMLPEVFTLEELRRLYEGVWGVELDAPNFRRKVLGTCGFVLPTGETRRGGRGRPAALYQGDSNGDAVLDPPIHREVKQ